MAAKKKRSAKQKANDKRLGKMAKSRVKKSKTKTKTRTVTKKRTVTKRKTNKPKKKRSSVKRSSSVKSILGSSLIKKVALGVGGGVLATAIISTIMPNSSVAKFAAPAGAFALGGIEGIIGQFALSMLTPRVSGNQNVAPQMEAL